jgi:uncharacterized coiled-coil protein SlyX
MAKSKALIAAEARIAELEAALAAANTALDAANARIDNAKVFFRAQREEIASLKAGAAIAVAQRSAAKPVPVVTRWTDNQGRVWEKTRIGAKASSRIVDEAAPEAAHHD